MHLEKTALLGFSLPPLKKKTTTKISNVNFFFLTHFFPGSEELCHFFYQLVFHKIFISFPPSSVVHQKKENFVRYCSVSSQKKNEKKSGDLRILCSLILLAQYFK